MSLYLCTHVWFRGITGPAPFLPGNDKYIHHRSYLSTYLSPYKPLYLSLDLSVYLHTYIPTCVCVCAYSLLACVYAAWVNTCAPEFTSKFTGSDQVRMFSTSILPAWHAKTILSVYLWATPDALKRNFMKSAAPFPQVMLWSLPRNGTVRWRISWRAPSPSLEQWRRHQLTIQKWRSLMGISWNIYIIYIIYIYIYYMYMEIYVYMCMRWSNQKKRA